MEENWAYNKRQLYSSLSLFQPNEPIYHLCMTTNQRSNAFESCQLISQNLLADTGSTVLCLIHSNVPGFIRTELKNVHKILHKIEQIID